MKQGTSLGYFNSNTVKPFMFACPLFHEFRELNKAVKWKGVNIDTVPTLIGITHVLEWCGLNSPKWKAPKMTVHAKSPTFRAAKLKGFYSFWTVCQKPGPLRLL